jgi:hypothetical protein
MLCAAQYAKELGLDADDAEDIQADLDSARKAWVQVLGSATKQYEVPARQEGTVDGEGEDDAALTELMTILGTTYNGGGARCGPGRGCGRVGVELGGVHGLVRAAAVHERGRHRRGRQL